MFSLFFAVVNPSFQNQTLGSQNKQFFPLFSEFHNKSGEREATHQIGKTPNQIRRVGFSAISHIAFIFAHLS